MRSTESSFYQDECDGEQTRAAVTTVVRFESKNNTRGDATYKNHIIAELASVLRVISAASSRAMGRRVKLIPPTIAMMAYKAPAL